MKLIKNLLSDLCEMCRPLIFDIALAIPIVAYTFTWEVVDASATLKHTLKGLAIGIFIDIVWVSIWVIITDFISKRKKIN